MLMPEYPVDELPRWIGMMPPLFPLPRPHLRHRALLQVRDNLGSDTFVQFLACIAVSFQDYAL
jgi:hypothetical protein